MIVLYEGRQIYFGRANEARDFFTSIGFHCPPRQTTADFLTSLTSPAERVVQPGFENQVPRTPDEFAEVWKKSEARAKLMQEVEAYEQKYPIGGNSYKQFVASRKAQKSKRQYVLIPFLIISSGLSQSTDGPSHHIPSHMCSRFCCVSDEASRD